MGKQMIEDSSGMSTGVGSRDTVGRGGRKTGGGASVLEGGSVVLEVIVLVPGSSRRILPMSFALQFDGARMTGNVA